MSVPHHDARPDKPYQGKGNSPNSTRALAEEPGRGMARAGVRMGRYLLSLGPNLRWVLTVHELVDVWGVRLPVQPACEQRMAACGLLFGEWPAGHGHGGAPGYSDSTCASLEQVGGSHPGGAHMHMRWCGGSGGNRGRRCSWMRYRRAVAASTEAARRSLHLHMKQSDLR